MSIKTMGAENFDVLIIGAGLSGLSAARRLKARDANLEIKILEASDRVGGRTYTIQREDCKDNTATMDLGGQWVSDLQTDVMDLINEFGISYFKQNITGTKVLQVESNDEVRTYESEIPNFRSKAAILQMHFLIKEIEALCKEIDIRDPYAHPKAVELDAMSLATFMRSKSKHQSVYNAFDAALNTVLGVDCTKVSALSYLAYANASGGIMKQMLVENGAAQQYRIEGGAMQISERIAEKLAEETIEFNCVVRTIKQENDLVTITDQNGNEFRGRFVICSAPINQLNKMDIQPPFGSEKAQLYQSYQIGNLSKFSVVYDEAFWTKKGYSGEVVSTGGPSKLEWCEKGPTKIWYDMTSPGGTPMLVGFSGGKSSDQWWAKSKEERKEAIIANLVSFFGKEAANPKEYHEKSWVHEPHIGGAPAGFFGPGTMHNFSHLRTPHEKIFFAGTDYAVSWTGYMSGAIQSGYKAAVDILATANPNSLIKQDKELLKFFDYDKKDYRTVVRTSVNTSESKSCAIL